MNFRLFRSSILLLSFLLLSIGWANANSITEYAFGSSKHLQTSHSNQHNNFCLPFELAEDNEVNENRKRFSSVEYTAHCNSEVYFPEQFSQLFYYNRSSIAPPSVPIWLKNAVLLI